jgi:hypothetical protein
VPIANNPNPFDPETEAKQFDQWSVEHQEEMEVFSSDLEQREEALTYLYIGRLIGANFGYRAPSYSPKHFPEYISSLNLLRTVSQDYMLSKLDKSGLLRVFEKEGILPSVVNDDEKRIHQATQRRGGLLGYIYVGYMLGTHIDDASFKA